MDYSLLIGIHDGNLVTASQANSDVVNNESESPYEIVDLSSSVGSSSKAVDQQDTCALNNSTNGVAKKPLKMRGVSFISGTNNNESGPRKHPLVGSTSGLSLDSDQENLPPAEYANEDTDDGHFSSSKGQRLCSSSNNLIRILVTWKFNIF